MCGGSGTVTTQTNQTTTPTPTAEETAMEKTQLAQYQQYAPAQTEMYNNAFALGNQLLTSFGDKSGSQWQSLIGGITPQQTQNQINTQDRSLTSQLQQSGIYDSGTAASGRLRAASDLSNQNAQFNVGAMQNALNLALSGQAQVQSPALGQTSQLGQQLAGLRTNQTTGSGMYPSTGFNAGIFGTWGSSYYGCWVAAEIFDGWHAPKTVAARFYINFVAPIWFTKFYLKYGERIAKFIHNKPILKLALRPLFECFALMGKKQMEGVLA